jgi:hypothetical protein
MTVHPRIPLTPDQLPQQRVVAVVDLPAMPRTFDPTVCLHWMPWEILPKARPRRMAYLGTVEWAWGPMSNRVEAYFLHRSRHHWVVWIRDPVPNDADSEWQVAAYTPRRGVTAREAAQLLVVARWRLEADERFLDHFHWVSDEGDLAVAEWMAIGRAVWPPVQEPAGAGSSAIRLEGIAS